LYIFLPRLFVSFAAMAKESRECVLQRLSEIKYTAYKDLS
jgi:hypothetical protein